MTNFQRKPLRKSDTSIKTFDDIKLPIFVEEFLSYGPKHPIKDKLNELHFLANVDKLVRNLRANELEGEKLCEKEVSAKWYARNIRETPVDRALHEWWNIWKKMLFLLNLMMKAMDFVLWEDKLMTEHTTGDLELPTVYRNQKWHW